MPEWLTGGRKPVADLDEASITADEAANMAEDLSLLLLDVPPEERHRFKDPLVRARDLLAELLAQLRPPGEPQGPPRPRHRAWDALGGRRGLRKPAP